MPEHRQQEILQMLSAPSKGAASEEPSEEEINRVLGFMAERTGLRPSEAA